MTIPLRHLEAIEYEGLSEAGPVPESWLLVCIHRIVVALAVARNDLPTTQNSTIGTS